MARTEAGNAQACILYKALIGPGCILTDCCCNLGSGSCPTSKTSDPHPFYLMYLSISTFSLSFSFFFFFERTLSSFHLSQHIQNVTPMYFIFPCHHHPHSQTRLKAEVGVVIGYRFPCLVCALGSWAPPGLKLYHSDK